MIKKFTTGLVVLLTLVSLQLADAQVGLADELKGNLVSLQGNDLKPYDASQLAKADYIAVYFSAHWCPPCRAFTPKLVEYYNSAKAKNTNFEVIFVSSDRSEGAMKDYMKDTGMRWPAVIYSKARGGSPLAKYAENGIPNLVFIDKTGKVISASFEGGNYVGPYKVLDDIRGKLK